MADAENLSSSVITKDEEEDDDVPVVLPGFRFHPTDEELVGFYLRRKVEKRELSMELIKQIDIYKYDPWDLPKSSNVGDTEWYFFCKRGRKYRNSIRPNRVTGSGFWKATGIDRPIYSSAPTAPAGENHHHCIGLKKSLVYYRGSAGKGTKTDWMMHEFRLPADHDKSTKHIDIKSIAQEAEVWTLCRILKRNMSHKRNWKEISTKRSNQYSNVNSTTYNIESCCDDQKNNYISFNNATLMATNNGCHHQLLTTQLNPISQPQFLSYSATANAYSSPVVAAPDIDELLKHEDWDEITQLF